MLTFQRLDVYRCSIDFLTLVLEFAEAVPRGHAELIDQLKRAAASVPINIAEASGRSGAADTARCFAIARGAAMECAAVLDVCRLLKVVDEAAYARGKELLERVVAMLTKLCR